MWNQRVLCCLQMYFRFLVFVNNVKNNKQNHFEQKKRLPFCREIMQFGRKLWTFKSTLPGSLNYSAALALGNLVYTIMFNLNFLCTLELNFVWLVGRWSFLKREHALLYVENRRRPQFISKCEMT